MSRYEEEQLRREVTLCAGRLQSIGCLGILALGVMVLGMGIGGWLLWRIDTNIDALVRHVSGDEGAR